MKTRSQTLNLEKHAIIEIDFDKASLAWNKNKNKLGNGCYEYKKNICEKNTKTMPSTAGVMLPRKRRAISSNIHCYKCLNEGKGCQNSL